MVPRNGTIECGIRIRFILVPRLQAKRPKNEVDLELFHEGNFRNHESYNSTISYFQMTINVAPVLAPVRWRHVSMAKDHFSV